MSNLTEIAVIIPYPHLIVTRPVAGKSEPRVGGDGNIEVIDGRWGASLRIDRRAESENIRSFWKPRPVPLFLYDLWNDPDCLNSLHEEKPDLVKKYTIFLQDQWKNNQELAKNFKRSKEIPITAEQLRTLRSLGYIK